MKNGRIKRHRSNFKGGYHQKGSPSTIQEPDNRFFRRHGRDSELRFRTDVRKATIARKRANNPRLVSFHFLHHNL